MTSVSSRRLTNARFNRNISDELNRLAVSDNWHSLWAVLASYLIIAAAVAAGESSPWLYPLAVLLIGARQRALTSILHDAAHGRAARSRWLNQLVGSYLSGYLIFQAFRPYRQSHVLDHHGHLGEPQQDPDFQLYLESGLYSGLTPARFFWRQVFATLFMLNAPGYLWYVIKHRLIALVQSKSEVIGFSLFWGVILLLMVSFDKWRLFLAYWMVPYFTAFMVIGRFIEIAEHYPMLGTSRVRTVLHSTRNRFSHPLEAIFCSMHRENYHLVHHLRPDIPFWNLHKAHVKLLEDPEYWRVNQQFGGIFVSSNGRPALIPALVSGKLALPAALADGPMPGSESPDVRYAAARRVTPASSREARAAQVLHDE
jgi:fatty acid desaturase